MPENVDEDLIEATIRRVAEAKARQAELDAASPADAPVTIDLEPLSPPSDAADGHSQSEAPNKDEAPNKEHVERSIESTLRRVAEANARAANAPVEEEGEDLIKSTIRRVADAKARMAETPIEARKEDEDPIEATIRRVAEAKARMDEAPSEAPERDDDPIEATIRRVAEAKARMDEAPAEAPQEDEDPIEATIRRVAEAKARRDDESAPFTEIVSEEAPEPVAEKLESEAPAEAAPSTETQEDIADAAVADKRGIDRWKSEPVAIGRPVRRKTAAPDSAPEEDAQQPAIVAQLADTAAALRELVARLEVVLPALERLADAPPAVHRPATFTPAPKSQPAAEDDWDDAPPKVASAGFGAPPRPAVVRDAPPRAMAPPPASRERSPEPVEEAPAARRGLELLPRTYRITVEDKRRSVDLVPLHRALLSMDGVKDMSLLSYNNGIAIVSLETVSEIDPDVLGKLVSRAMSRDARVEVHNENTLVVKLGED